MKLLSCLVGCASLVLAATTGVEACDFSQGPCHIPLVNPKYLAHKIEIQNQLAKVPTTGIVRHRKRQITINPLSGTGDTGGTLFAYHGQLLVGTPPQKFDILFDTGSQQLWLQSTTTKGGINAAGTLFDPSKSSTFKDTKRPASSIEYVDGTTVEGVLVQDVVSINNLTVPDLIFELATSITSTTSDMDGIMGMSFSLPATAAAPNQPTYFERLVSDKKVTSPVFSYYIDNSNMGGGLTLGGVDSARMQGTPVTIPVAASGNDASGKPVYLFWQSVLNSVSFAGSPQKLTMAPNFAVVFDTGTSLAVLPVAVARTLNTALNFVKARQSEPSADLYVMDCSNGKIPSGLPDISFDFGGIALTVTPQEYIFFQSGNQPGQVACVSGFAGQDLSSGTTGKPGDTQALLPSAIFGNVFLRRFYTVFNLGEHKMEFAIAERSTNVNTSLSGGGSSGSPGASPSGSANAGYRPDFCWMGPIATSLLAALLAF
ncbi:hypothetical protein PhCBS80983_g02450 [Powellomyces hirtus]|uniref:Peptidase A1 domain-containing protein n=1 Tax=Powellomyces hirtus TaxID=109895 RepID=A0A507E6J9_9FUNG|nr:hypothetical protein PhCBS80983_g02450 [Powellomyces hirtus]